MVDCVRFEINATVHEQIEHYEKKKKHTHENVLFLHRHNPGTTMSPELILGSYSNRRIGGVKCCKDCVSFGASPWSYTTTTCFIWEIRGKPLELYND